MLFVYILIYESRSLRPYRTGEFWCTVGRYLFAKLGGHCTGRALFLLPEGNRWCIRLGQVSGEANHDMHYAFDIGGSKIEFGAFGAAGDIQSHIKVPTPADDRDAFVAVIAGVIGDADAEFGAASDIGISFAGGLDPQTGAGISVFAIILGTGVGGGIVVDGQFIGGRSGIRGEWGHGNDVSGALIRHGLAAVRCGCGRTGCLDAWGGARGLERIYAQISGQGRPSYDITDGWQNGDAIATHAVEIFVDLIAGELALMVNVLDPDCVPVGGGLASEGRLITMIDDQVRDRVLGRYDAPLVMPGRYHRAGGLRGAPMLHLLDDRAGV